MIRRQRVALVTVGLAIGNGLVGCAGPAARQGGHGSTPTPSSAAASSASTSVRTTVSPSPPRSCSNLEMLSTWSVARRAAQLVVAPALDFNPGAVQVAVAAGAGGILFLGGGQPPANLTTQLRTALARSVGQPAPAVMADEEGGAVQRLEGAVPSVPSPRVMAQSMSLSQVQALATEVGTSMRQVGVSIDLAPVVDLDARPGPSASDPDGSRSFSADPAVASNYAIAFLHGLQAAGVLPVVKHFPGLGGASGNTDYGPATTPPLAELQTAGLLPFRAAVAAGGSAVMVSNAAVPGLTALPASLSPAAIDGLLRHTLGFEGLVLTDSLSAGAVTQAGYDLPHAATAAVEAGADMILFGSTLTPAQTLLLSPQNVAMSITEIVDAMVAATTSGALPTARLDSAVEHVLAARNVDLCR